MNSAADEPRLERTADRIGPPGIDGDLRMISAAIEALGELAAEQAREGPKVYDFSIKWGVLMAGRLERLEHYNRSGELTQEQERCYREIRRRLKNALPQIERLAIGRPTVALED